MGIKSEKTFEEVVERIVALFRPQHGSDAREFDNSDHSDHEIKDGSPNPTENVSANHNGDGDSGGRSDAPAPSAASQDNPTARRRRTPAQNEEIPF
jgi:hypothetical protein